MATDLHEPGGDGQVTEDGDRPRDRHSWRIVGLSASGVAIAVSVAAYIYGIASDIGGMHRQLDVDTLRIDALEQRGSGPVQSTMERVTGLAGRVDRILTEVLDMQKRLADLSTRQQTDSVILHRLKDDFDHNKPP